MEFLFDHEKLKVYQLELEFIACVAKRACTAERVLDGKRLLHRIVSILTKLVNRFSPADAVAERESEYRMSGFWVEEVGRDTGQRQDEDKGQDENENEDEDEDEKNV